MKIGVTLRNMGSQSSTEIMLTGARYAEQLGYESLWITDHIAIPPDDAEGSDGRYTDPLTTLAFLAGATMTINVAVGVMIAPYRPALPTLKQIATVQELSSGRLIVGFAVGWMDAEFRALGINRAHRGKLTDELLELFHDCFSNHVVSQNGQDFIFSPRPAPPPVYIGGGAPQALKRALKFGHGWLPMVRDPERLGQDLVEFQRMADERGVARGPVTAMGRIPLKEPDESRRLIEAYRELGVDRLVVGAPYDTMDEYRMNLDQLAKIVGL